MIGKIAAIVTAAVCAGLFVGGLPGLAPEVAASAIEHHRRVSGPAKPEQLDMWSPTAVAIQMTLDAARYDRKIACAETWPYYESSCLRDERQGDGNARNVRIILAKRPALFQAGQRGH